MKNFLECVHHFVWGAPALILIISVGLLLSWRLNFVQFRLFPEALKGFLRQFRPGRPDGRDSSFQALCTALAATV